MTRSTGNTTARVIAIRRDQYLLQFPEGEKTAKITGRFRHEARTAVDFPAVGDWVDAEIVGSDSALIHSIHPRTTILSRRASGQTLEEQVLAANVDIAFIVTSYNEDFSARRLERYIAMARQAGIEPVLVLNKSDLVTPDDPRLNEAKKISGVGAVYGVSAHTGQGLEPIELALHSGKIGIFLGSSGVGKSTLLNRFLGKAVQATQTIRLSDGKGRHTTTTRQMFGLPQGGFMIDTPGLREIQLWADETVLPEVYDDIASLAQSCQFGNCRHGTEPGCAVKRALESGALEEGRWTGYLKLQKELAYLKRKQDPEQQANTKKRWKKIHKDMRDHVQRKKN